MEWYTLALWSALFSSLSMIVTKKTLMKEHAMEFATVFSLSMLLFSLPLFFVADFNITLQNWAILIFGSIISAIGFLYLTKAVRHMEISEASPIFSFDVAFVAIIAFFFLGEMITTKQIGGMGFILVGAYLLEFRHIKGKKAELLYPLKVMMRSKYIHYILLGLALYAISGVIIRFLLNTANPNAINPYTFLLVHHFIIFLVFVCMIHKFHNGMKGIKHGMKSAGKYIFLAAFVLFISRVLMVHTLTIPTAMVALVLSVKRMSSLFATVIGGEIFKDHHLKKKIVASIIMIIGAIIIVT